MLTRPRHLGCCNSEAKPPNNRERPRPTANSGAHPIEELIPVVCANRLYKPAWLRLVVRPHQQPAAVELQITLPRDPAATATEVEAEDGAEGAAAGGGAEEGHITPARPTHPTHPPNPQTTKRPSRHRPAGYRTSRAKTRHKMRLPTTMPRCASSAPIPSATTRSPPATTSPATSAPCA